MPLHFSSELDSCIVADVPAAGHMLVTRQEAESFDAGAFQYIASYCKTCEICQSSQNHGN